MASGRKRTLGRKKIEIKLIEDENARMVTFCKRRAGLFKKASELSTMCGVQIAIILQSMAGKMHSFGSPNVDVVIDSYENQNHRGIQNWHFEKYREAKMNDLYQKINEAERQLAEEKSKSATLLGQEDDLQLYIEKQDHDGLKKLLKSLQQFKEEIVLSRRKIATASEASSSRSGKEVIPNTTNYDVSGSPIPDDWLKL